MIKFKKLKLKGFKSFVEPTEIIIEQGLTGIVGPNGCGKSNLVEAFRFVMGELSPKQMRGSELDDVIFNGTADRPAWDIADRRQRPVCLLARKCARSRRRCGSPIPTQPVN